MARSETRLRPVGINRRKQVSKMEGRPGWRVGSLSPACGGNGKQKGIALGVFTFWNFQGGTKKERKAVEAL